MGSKSRPSIVVEQANELRKICKIWFGADGSYYVTVPYHKANKALLLMQTLNYATGPMHLVPLRESLELASLEDDGRLKLSHHPDGFCQFSGQGILSGRKENGEPKGVGVQARALLHVAKGPTFALVFHGLHDFAPYEKLSEQDILLTANRLSPLPVQNGLVIEGWYFPPDYRRFVETDDERRSWIQVSHPSSAVLRLRVVLAPSECAIPGLIGLDFYAAKTDATQSGYMLTGPGGNLRDNEKGQNVGDMITAIYPAPEGVEARRDVGYSS